MFCLECGAEISPRAEKCSVCGHVLAGRSQETQRNQGNVEAASSFPGTASNRGALVFTPPPARPSIASGDLDLPGMPRDALGRVLLVTVVAMAADLLVPWSIVYGQRVPMAHVGAPAIALVLLYVLTVVPVIRPAYRKHPIVAAFPLASGAFCLGIGAMYWVLLARENAAAMSTPNGPGATAVVISPDVGLYLFLLGAAALTVIGHQMFLAAAESRAQIRAFSSAHALLPALRPHPPSSDSAIPVATSPAIDAPVNAIGPLSSQAGEQANFVPPAQALSAAASGITGDALAASAELASTSLAAEDTASAQVVLPGSPGWNLARESPAARRPSSLAGAWQQYPNTRR